MNREPIKSDDIALISQMSEGNPGAINILMDMVFCGLDGYFAIHELDKMNIRGTQIWVAFKDYCHGDLDAFLESISNSDPKMLEAINIATARRFYNNDYIAEDEIPFKAVPRVAFFQGERPVLSAEEIQHLAAQPKPVKSGKSKELGGNGK